MVLPPPARGPGTLIPSAQRLVWAAKQPLQEALQRLVNLYGLLHGLQVGKNTGVGCHFLLQCMKVEGESDASCSLTLCKMEIKAGFLQMTNLELQWCQTWQTAYCFTE